MFTSFPSKFAADAPTFVAAAGAISSAPRRSAKELLLSPPSLKPCTWRRPKPNLLTGPSKLSKLVTAQERTPPLPLRAAGFGKPLAPPMLPLALLLLLQRPPALWWLPAVVAFFPLLLEPPLLTASALTTSVGLVVGRCKRRVNSPSLIRRAISSCAAAASTEESNEPNSRLWPRKLTTATNRPLFSSTPSYSPHSTKPRRRLSGATAAWLPAPPSPPPPPATPLFLRAVRITPVACFFPAAATAPCFGGGGGEEDDDEEEEEKEEEVMPLACLFAAAVAAPCLSGREEEAEELEAKEEEEEEEAVVCSSSAEEAEGVGDRSRFTTEPDPVVKTAPRLGFFFSLPPPQFSLLAASPPVSSTSDRSTGS
mmetsp:Transcript_75849/g.148583  ORF Transcript_75849/g.148583 Transcript_75849/m.148583 type:complete len:368 (-) Transcript_75849:1275-2378(-)